MGNKPSPRYYKIFVYCNKQIIPSLSAVDKSNKEYGRQISMLATNDMSSYLANL